MGKLTDDKVNCGHCNLEFHHTQVDAVFLNEEQTEASGDAYCQTCFPHVRVFDWDKWTALDAGRAALSPENGGENHG